MCITGFFNSLKKNKDIIQKFTEAVYQGQVWVKTHPPQEVAEAIKPSFPDTDIEILKTVVQRYKDIDAWCQESDEEIGVRSQESEVRELQKNGKLAP